jgi:hypothetical protein
MTNEAGAEKKPRRSTLDEIVRMDQIGRGSDWYDIVIKVTQGQFEGRTYSRIARVVPLNGNTYMVIERRRGRDGTVRNIPIAARIVQAKSPYRK